jgi:beta-1,4-mannooligosaccharide phosphorylase
VTWQSEVIQAVSWFVLRSAHETDAGWLVLTHGVGAMRTYRIGAILLDLDNPTRILGQLQQQLLSPAPDEQDGYVPNVFYSCDPLVQSLPELLDALSPSPTRPRL